MGTEISTNCRQAAARLWPELPPSLTESERRNPFRLQTVFEDGITSSRKVFIPPSEFDRGVLEQVQDALEFQLQPAAPEVIVASLARIANHFKTDRSPAEW